MIHHLTLSPSLLEYVRTHSVRDDPVLRELREHTHRLPLSTMQVPPEEGQLLHLLVGLVGARRALEVGVYTGYSALCMARALPPDGELVAIDVSDEWTAVAREYWSRAGVAERVSLRIGKARDVLSQLLCDGEAETFDLAFVDADKESVDFYYESCLRLVRRGGLVVVDNTLWSGLVADASVMDDETAALRAINAKLARDERVDVSMLAVADGLTLARKR